MANLIVSFNLMIIFVYLYIRHSSCAEENSVEYKKEPGKQQRSSDLQPEASARYGYGGYDDRYVDGGRYDNYYDGDRYNNYNNRPYNYDYQYGGYRDYEGGRYGSNYYYGGKDQYPYGGRYGNNYYNRYDSNSGRYPSAYGDYYDRGYYSHQYKPHSSGYGFHRY